MKQEQHNIDNLFQQGFQDFEPSAPPPVWDNVNAQLQKRKRRRLLPIFWLSSLIGVGLIGYYIGNQKPNNTANTTTQAVTPTQQLTNINSTEAIEKIEENSVFEIKQNKNMTITSSKKAAKKQIVKYDTKIVEASSSNNFAEFNNENPPAITTNHANPQNMTANLIEVLLPQPINWANNPQFKKALKEDCYTFQKKNWLSPALEVYIGGVYVQPRFSTTSNEPTNYKNLRDSSEKYVLAGDIGLWFNPVHRSGIGIRSGIHASRWIEELDRVNAYEERYQLVVTQVKDNQGNVIQNDTSFGWVRGRLVQKYYNHYASLNIPLQVGFEYLKPSRTQYFAYAGAMLNLRFWSKGEIYDTSEKIISFSRPNKVFETNIGMSLIGHIGMRHRLTEHWWLTESLQCNYTLNSITDKAHPLKQRNINVGIQVGLRYKF